MRLQSIVEWIQMNPFHASLPSHRVGFMRFMRVGFMRFHIIRECGSIPLLDVGMPPFHHHRAKMPGIFDR